MAQGYKIVPPQWFIGGMRGCGYYNLDNASGQLHSSVCRHESEYFSCRMVELEPLGCTFLRNTGAKPVQEISH